MQIKISNFKFIILLFVCVSGLFGQVNEEFSGATFNQSGYWSGTLDHYITNAQGQGQLNAPDGGTSYFSTPITWQDSTQFSHYIKMNFPPSDANRLSIYLLNENADLNIGNGLFLAIGEDGADDGVTLKYGTQNDALPIAEAGNGQFAGIVEGTFKGLVTQGHLLIEFQKPDQTIITIYDGARPDEFTMGFPTHFGFWMTYTVTRKDQFYFDDINIQKVVADNMGPVAKSIVATGLNTFIITFDEEIESTGLINPANFKITNGNSVPISINSIEVQGLNLFRWLHPGL